MKKIIFILFIYLLLISNVLAREKSPVNYIVNNCKFSELCTVTYAELSAIVQDNVTKSNIQQFSITTEKDFPVIYKLTDIGINYIVPSETELYNNKDKIYHYNNTSYYYNDENHIENLYNKLNNDKAFKLRDGRVTMRATGVQLKIKFQLNKKLQKVDIYSIFHEEDGYIFPILDYYYYEPDITYFERNLESGASTIVTYGYEVGSQLGVLSETSDIKFTIRKEYIVINSYTSLNENRIEVFDNKTKGITITYDYLKNMKETHDEIPPTILLKYRFFIEDYYEVEGKLETFIISYTITMPVFIGNCTLSGKVEFANEKTTDGYIFFNIANALEDVYEKRFAASTQYQKLNDDGTFLLKSIPDYEWKARTRTNADYLKPFHTLNAFDLDGNSGEIVERKLTCESVFEIMHEEE